MEVICTKLPQAILGVALVVLLIAPITTKVSPLVIVKVPVPETVMSVMLRVPVILSVFVPGELIMMLSIKTGPATDVPGLQLPGSVQLLLFVPVHVYVSMVGLTLPVHSAVEVSENDVSFKLPEVSEVEVALLELSIDHEPAHLFNRTFAAVPCKSPLI